MSMSSNTVVYEDRLAAVSLIQDLKVKVSEVIGHVQSQLAKVKHEQWSTSKGVSFLEVKYQMLLSYLINLTQLMCVRVSGKSIKNSPAIDRLVEIRTVLEKMRPIDQKLRYQIDKLLKTVTTGTVGQNDPLRFKPNPDNLQSKFADNSEVEEEEAGTDKKTNESKVYRPPKLAAVFYDGDETPKERQQRMLEKAKKRALSSSVIQELRAEYQDGPEEIVETADLQHRKLDKAARERQEYEEKYFLRMTVTKKERNEGKVLRSNVNDLTKFGDISILDDERQLENLVSKKKSKGLKRKGSKKGGKKFKKRK